MFDFFWEWPHLLGSMNEASKPMMPINANNQRNLYQATTARLNSVQSTADQSLAPQDRRRRGYEVGFAVVLQDVSPSIQTECLSHHIDIRILS
jgi:hypothetical protein